MSVVLMAFVFAGLVPVAAGAYQILLAALHGWRNHYDRWAPNQPNVAVLVPAWNEAPVLSASIDRLMALDYPPERLRVYVIDDASTDDTAEVLAGKAREYPGRVVHLRRDKGGEGKSHTLNHGLAHVLADSWMQALLVMDADVIYAPDSLTLMARHLADPAVGAVTAYIREGSHPGTAVNRFIGFEYISAQAAARRGQNVLGVLACLAGGAQLHTRANIEAIGGRIDTTSLAEDTFTTFDTQLAGHRVLFEPHATVLAEEPGGIRALWKQRLRWARGNLQVTWHYRRVWFRRTRANGGLGGITFGIIWWGLLLQPALMVLAAAGLLTLHYTQADLASRAFQVLWIGTGLAFVFTTTFVLLIDPSTARRVWRQALLFPGLVALAQIVYALFTAPLRWAATQVWDLLGVSPGRGVVEAIVVFTYAWVAAGMLVAYLAKVVEGRRFCGWLAPVLLYLGGYGSLLCAVTATAYVKQLRGAEMRWDKTEKTGKVLVR